LDLETVENGKILKNLPILFGNLPNRRLRSHAFMKPGFAVGYPANCIPARPQSQELLSPRFPFEDV
jgi:hypothetical protein